MDLNCNSALVTQYVNCGGIVETPLCFLKCLCSHKLLSKNLLGNSFSPSLPALCMPSLHFGIFYGHVMECYGFNFYFNSWLEHIFSYHLPIFWFVFKYGLAPIFYILFFKFLFLYSALLQLKLIFVPVVMGELNEDLSICLHYISNIFYRNE